jgi:hypothetical protein
MQNFIASHDLFLSRLSFSNPSCTLLYSNLQLSVQIRRFAVIAEENGAGGRPPSETSREDKRGASSVNEISEEHPKVPLHLEVNTIVFVARRDRKPATLVLLLSIPLYQAIQTETSLISSTSAHSLYVI